MLSISNNFFLCGVYPLQRSVQGATVCRARGRRKGFRKAADDPPSAATPQLLPLSTPRALPPHGAPPSAPTRRHSSTRSQTPSGCRGTGPLIPLWPLDGRPRRGLMPQGHRGGLTIPRGLIISSRGLIISFRFNNLFQGLDNL